MFTSGVVTICPLCGDSTNCITGKHPICEGRELRNLAPLRSAMDGCICCSGAFAHTLITTHGVAFNLCHRCRFGTIRN